MGACHIDLTPMPDTADPALAAADLDPRPELGQLFAQLYPRLKRLAHAQLRRNEAITLLDTQGLVHETYLRMAGDARSAITDPGQFLGYACRVMRFVVVDFVRRRHALRRGGGLQQVTLDTGDGAAAAANLGDEQLLRMHEAMAQLSQVDERLVQIIEMRCFGGLGELQVAQALGLTDRTVRRQWAKAKVLLQAATEAA